MVKDLKGLYGVDIVSNHGKNFMTHGLHSETPHGPTLVVSQPLMEGEMIKIKEDLTLEHEVREDILMHDNRSLPSCYQVMTAKRINLEAYNFHEET